MAYEDTHEPSPPAAHAARESTSCMSVQVREAVGVPSATLPRPRRSLIPSVPRTVLALGLTSLFTDISSEMVSTILPLYFVVSCELTPLAVRARRRAVPGRSARSSGSRAASSPTAGAAHKEVAVAGYGALGRLQARAAGRRRRLAAIAVVIAARPDRQGHPHRPARRADLAQHARARSWRPRSASTARSTPPARCSGR